MPNRQVSRWFFRDSQMEARECGGGEEIGWVGGGERRWRGGGQEQRAVQGKKGESRERERKATGKVGSVRLGRLRSASP
jgi:hypothetical protein